MNLIFDYLKEKRFVLASGFCMFSFFSLSFYLYRLPLAAVFYPYMVCIIAFAIFGIFDFRQFTKKHGELQLLKQNIDIINDVSNMSHVSDTLFEKDYIEIVNTLVNQRRQVQDEFSGKYNDMTQYYTVWIHQIKTPIACMRLMLQNEDSSASRKLTAELSKIEHYVQMVMVYLRISSDSTDYVFAQHSLDELIKKAVKSFSTEFIEKKISLKYTQITQKVTTDEKWFLFLLEQIISNALKYTRKGSVEIYLNSEGFLCIEDSGMGIAPEDLPRIFENGYTGNIGRIDKKSSGIGLYLCKTVCDKLDIPISAHSALEKGTTIKLDIKNLTKM